MSNQNSNLNRMRDAARNRPGKKPPPKHPQPKAKPKPKDDRVGTLRIPRLPNGSEFHARWDEKAQQWHGVLNVTATATHPEHLFSLHSGGVRSLCFKLDKLYRDWLGEYLKTGADIPHQKEG